MSIAKRIDTTKIKISSSMTHPFKLKKYLYSSKNSINLILLTVFIHLHGLSILKKNKHR
jgi:hypothetical protein